MRLSAAAFFVLAVVGFAAERSGWAYVRATVAGNGDLFLYWPTRNVGYQVNRQGYSGLSLADVVGAIRRSFLTWSAPGCTDFSFTFIGLTDVDQTNVTRPSSSRPDERNVIRWRETSWPPEDATHSSISSDWLALTVLVYDVDTGEIIDADMDLNGVNFRWTTTDDPTERATDVQNVVTHEVGHIVGLGHTSVVDATMHAMQPQGEISKRDLHSDDIEGLCAIYPFGHPTTLGDRQPIPTLELIGDSGCQSTGMAGSWRGFPLLLFVALVRLRLGGRRRHHPGSQRGRLP